MAEQQLVDVDATDSRGLTALMLVAGAGHEACLRLLLRRGASLDIQDLVGWTAATHAAFNGQDQSIRLLGAGGAELDVRDFLGTTPAMRAALGGHGACLKQLAAGGADLGLRDNLGIAAAEHARRSGHTDCAKLLGKLGREAPRFQRRLTSSTRETVLSDREFVDFAPTLLSNPQGSARRLGSQATITLDKPAPRRLNLDSCAMPAF